MTMTTTWKWTTEEQQGLIKDGRHFVPVAEDNADYQEYLEWVAEGNEPLPADEPLLAD